MLLLRYCILALWMLRAESFLTQPAKRGIKHRVICRNFEVDPNNVAPALFEPKSLYSLDTAIFLISIVPFGWATVEFWRRVSVGEAFGTGLDRVIIGEDSNPSSSRGPRILGKVITCSEYTSRKRD